MEYQPGKFITIEGTEGVGKSTNIAFIRELLEAQGISVLQTREPGGTPLAEQIRDILLQNRDEKMDETTELLLVFAARSQHLQQVILPALKSGQWVLCDRFTDATYAYQGGGRGLDTDLIESLEEKVQGDIHPDITFVLDIDVRTGLERAAQRGELDRFENEAIEFFEKVRAAYRNRVEKKPSRYALIDAGQTLDKVQLNIKQALQGFLKDRN